MGDDFVVGQKYNLPVISPVDDKGVFTEEAGQFEGMFYDKANKEITDLLKENGSLLKLEFITHSYPMIGVLNLLFFRNTTMVCLY